MCINSLLVPLFGNISYPPLPYLEAVGGKVPILTALG
jgi:hypothetical protein